MLRNAGATLGISYRCIHQCHPSALFVPCIGRYISTKSAIDKGLRKSRHGRSRFDPPARLGEITKRDGTGREPSHYQSNGPNLERQSSLSNDDYGPTSRIGSLISKRRRLLRADNSDFVQSQHGNNSSRSRSPNSRASSSLLRNQSGKLGVKAAPLNRAQRRAAAFGHIDNPPDGYKALPAVSTKQHSWSHHPSDAEWTVLSHHSRSRREIEDDQEPAVKDPDGGRWMSKPRQEDSSDQLEGSTASFAERPRRKSRTPLAIPYTTPASEFLYGHSVVVAALKGSRRKLYKIYLYQGDTAEVRGQDRQVRKLALAANVEVTRVGGNWLRLMDKMSGGRPHNVSSKFCTWQGYR